MIVEFEADLSFLVRQPALWERPAEKSVVKKAAAGAARAL